MAAPVYQTQGSLAAGNRSTAPVPVPSGVAADNVIITLAHFESDAAITPPSGFTQKYMREQNDAGGAFREYVFWKRATGADSGTYDFSWDATSPWSEWVALRISGCVTTGDPFGADDLATIPAGAQTVIAPIGILCETETLAIAAYGSFAGNADFSTPGGPQAWTERFDGGAMAVNTSTVTAGGGQFAAQITVTSGTCIGQICCLRAATSVAFTEPTVVNISNQTVVNSGTACDVAWPLGSEANDIAICVLHAKNNLAWTVPTNWADVFTQQNNGTTQRAGAMWIRTAGGESGTVNFAIGSSSTLVRSGLMYLVRNAIASGSPFDGAAVVNADSTADDNIEWSDYDPAVADDLICWLGYYADDLTTPASSIAGTPTAALTYEFETSTGTDLTTAMYCGNHTGSHAAVGTRSAATTSTADAVSVGVVFGILKASAAAANSRPTTVTTQQAVSRAATF